MIRTILLVCASIPVISGCSTIPAPLAMNLYASDRMIKTCAELFVATENEIAKAGVKDIEAARIEGYPYLRVNRFLSDFRHDLPDSLFPAWIDRLQELAVDGWQVELGNLPESKQNKLNNLAKAVQANPSTLTQALRECGQRLSSNDLSTSVQRLVLKEKAIVPSDYLTWRRIAGLYPLTALPMRLGIARWHYETQKNFGQSLVKLPNKGRLVRYLPAVPPDGPVDPGRIADIIKKSSANPLAIPEPTNDHKNLLFDQFAPVFEIDTATDDDRFGIPTLEGNELVTVETKNPTVYRKLSHTRMGELNLIQLNYLIWFPSRPKQSAIDLLGGHLDGIVWRVTLLPNGRPMMFDSIHLCGCYHLFFPTQYANQKLSSFNFNEPDFVPQSNWIYTDRSSYTVRIAAASHYIDRLYFGPDASDHALVYRLRDADTLRSLPGPDGQRRSLFTPNGFVAGTERNERFFFWPMGIVNPGAMRQWGHHATAFVGRRHFDDPRLFERSFILRRN